LERGIGSGIITAGRAEVYIGTLADSPDENQTDQPFFVSEGHSPGTGTIVHFTPGTPSPSGICHPATCFFVGGIVMAMILSGVPL